MKRSIWLVAACAWLALGCVHAADLSQRDLTRLERAITQIQGKLSRWRDEHSALQSQLRDTELAISALSQQIAANDATRGRLERELGALRERRRTLSGQRQQQQVLVAAQLRAAFQMGRERSLKVLLNQQDPAAISRAMTYVEYFNRARARQIDALSATLEELAGTEASIAEKSAAAARLSSELTHQKAELGRQQAARQQTMASLQQAIRSDTERLRQHQEDRQRLEALLNTVEDVAASFAASQDARPFAERKGKLRWPVEGKIVNRFGSPRTDGGLRWQGVVIRPAKAARVRAIHHGRVVFANWFRGQGLLLIVDHGEGYMSLYGHNESLLRQTGDWVNAGDAIATISANGSQTEQGLYFEIRHKGKAGNPTLWCRP